MKTRDRILEVALKLFNNYGLPKVTLRSISKEMGISQGNLNYHFKKREDIIEALYFQLVEKIDKRMLEPELIGLQLLFNVSTHIMQCSFEYRFFLLDFVQIVRENSTIKKHYAGLVAHREGQFEGVFQQLVEGGIMRPEKFNKEYHNLYKRFHILGDFWISSAEIVNDKVSRKNISEYSILIFQAIFPYLSPLGEKQFNAIVKD